MKQKFFIVLALLFLALILIGLNAASYVQKAKADDTELRPNRSTYNLGATGTRAFYDFLKESGYNVNRWRKPISDIGYFDSSVVSTFVVVGRVRREFTNDEITKLMNWVSSGGRLVIIDRDPPNEMVASTSFYSLVISGGEKSMSDIEKETMLFSVDPSSQTQMTAETKAARVLQPSGLTLGVNAIQSSKFASSIMFSRMKSTDEVEDETSEEAESTFSDTEDANADISESPVSPPNENVSENSNAGDVTVERDAQNSTDETEDIEEAEESGDEKEPALLAPVAHIGNGGKTLLVDFPFDSGRIVFLSDPYIVANGGIRLADNVQLAANIVGSKAGIIAFDEYHQGYSNNENRMLAYFAGTPIVPIFLQLLVLTAVIFFSQSRRFARALPLGEPNRLSKLEYISAMAQLQRRTKAFDLAIENIYSDFRRRIARLVGVDNHSTSREDLAELISERTEYSAKEIDELMFKCEDIMVGEPTTKREVVQITGKLREIEKRLGVVRQRRKR